MIHYWPRHQVQWYPDVPLSINVNKNHYYGNEQKKYSFITTTTTKVKKIINTRVTSNSDAKVITISRPNMFHLQQPSFILTHIKTLCITSKILLIQTTRPRVQTNFQYSQHKSYIFSPFYRICEHYLLVREQKLTYIYIYDKAILWYHFNQVL